VKLSSALEQGPLRKAQLVAGSVQVMHDISWVQVVDHPDIESWVKEGHLLLSTGYNWPKDPQQAFRIIQALSAKRVAGVVLAVPHFLEHFPEKSLEAANVFGMPLLEIPWEVPFSEITQFVHREIVDQQGRELAQSEQIHRKLTEAAVSSQSLRNIAHVLGRVLGRTVLIISFNGGLLGVATQQSGDEKAFPVGDEIAGRNILESLRGSQTQSRFELKGHLIRTKAVLCDGSDPTPLSVYAAHVGDDQVGYIAVCEDVSPLSALDIRAMEHAGTVVALQISHQRELMLQEARLGYALVASLIEGHFEASPRAFERAQLIGWNANIKYHLCTVLLDEPNPLSRDGFAKRESFAEQVRHNVARQGFTPLMSLSANQIHILLPEQVDPEVFWTNFLPTRMAMGVSQLHSGVEGMTTSGKEVAELVEHLKPGRVHRYAEMLFPRVLAGDPVARKEFLNRVLTHLDLGNSKQNLLETVLALAQEGFHLQKSAERLGVHISTLRYRVDRLQALTGLNLGTAEGKFRLQLAAHLYLSNLA
jgi:PucR family transcriptional regulator, purine catabolism regulatory protein